MKTETSWKRLGIFSQAGLPRLKQILIWRLAYTTFIRKNVWDQYHQKEGKQAGPSRAGLSCDGVSLESSANSMGSALPVMNPQAVPRWVLYVYVVQTLVAVFPRKEQGVFRKEILTEAGNWGPFSGKYLGSLANNFFSPFVRKMWAAHYNIHYRELNYAKESEGQHSECDYGIMIWTGWTKICGKDYWGIFIFRKIIFPDRQEGNLSVFEQASNMIDPGLT